MRDKKVQDMTLIALLAAIMAVLLATNTAFVLAFGIIEITLLHVIVIIGALYGGKRVGIILATLFGVFSLIAAWGWPTSPLSYVFRNPVVSVLPRIAFGAMIIPLYAGIGRVLKQFRDFKHRDKLHYGLTFVLSTFIHTILVLPLLFYFAVNHPPAEFAQPIQEVLDHFENSFLVFFGGILAVNGVIEIAIALVIGTPIAYRLASTKTSDTTEG